MFGSSLARYRLLQDGGGNSPSAHQCALHSSATAVCAVSLRQKDTLNCYVTRMGTSPLLARIILSKSSASLAVHELGLMLENQFNSVLSLNFQSWSQQWSLSS